MFVGNIAFSTTEDDIRKTFSEKGNIVGIRLPTDPESGRPKGFGYVQFSSVDEARAALNDLQGTVVSGRPLRLDFTTPRSNDSQRGGHGGGRGGRAGRGGRGGGRGGAAGRGGRGPGTGANATKANTTKRSGFGEFSGKKVTFD